MARIRGDTIINETGLAVPVTHDLKLDFLPKLALQAVYSVSTPALKTFPAVNVDIVLDKINVVGHGFKTGLKGQFTTDGTLPGGITALTDYFIIRIDDDMFRIATSLANAQSGTYELINSTGSGNHTFNPTAYSGASIGLSSSNDGANFVELPTCQVAIASGGTSVFNVVEPAYRFLRFKFVPISGAVDLAVHLNGYDSLGGAEGTGQVQ